MEKIGIFYGSSTGLTASIAKKIHEKLGVENADLHDIRESTAEDIAQYNNLIFGSSTWGIGEIQDDWEIFLPRLNQINFNGKTLALFGLGDQESYPDSFVDAVGVLYNEFKNSGCKLTGEWPADNYHFSFSHALQNGKFVGLPIDEETQPDKTDLRINKWIEKIMQDFT